MDSALFRILNGLAGHSAAWDRLIAFCASDLQYVLVALLVVVALLPPRKIKMAVVAIVSATIARWAVKPFVLLFVNRARPYVFLENVRNVIGAQTGEEYQSFPSGHALFFFALAAATYHYNRRLGWTLFAGATAMGVARVIGGIHWPSDILCGAIGGILIAWCVTRALSSFLQSSHNRNA